MPTMPMFPLNMVLFPAMPTALRIFEERYLVMLSRILEQEPAEFGIVLIERGFESGGGEHRFRVGTVAQIAQLQAGENAINLIAQGERRIEVIEWLDDDPHPRALVQELPRLSWQTGLDALLQQADSTVRRALAQASEFEPLPWSADAELSDDPVDRAWQLAGIAPLGQLDQLSLLRSTSLEQLLRGVIRLTGEAADLRAARQESDLDEELAALIAQSEPDAGAEPEGEARGGAEGDDPDDTVPGEERGPRPE